MGKMLIIADHRKSCVATSRGLELARKLEHSVEVVSFVDAPLRGLKANPTAQAQAKKRLLSEREALVQARIDKCVKAGQKVTLKVVWSKDIPGSVIKRCEKPLDLVVKTGHDTGSLIHTSTDWQLLRECPVPVLIVAEKRWHRTRPIVAAVDLGSSSRVKQALNRKVIAQAQALAVALEADLSLICAIEIPVLLSDLDLVDPVAYVREAREEMDVRAAKLAQEFDLPASSFTLKRGPVAKVITSHAARKRAQLVVMGTVGRRGVKARLLGNTAESVLEHLHTDVLALKT